MKGKPMKRRPAGACVGAIAVFLFAAPCVAAGSDYTIVIPEGADGFNVVKHGGLDNTGRIDCTEKLKKWLWEKRGVSKSRLYFPKGTYLVSGSLCMKINRSRSARGHSHGPRIIGENRTGTVIRLKDGTWPKAVYKLGPGAGREKKIDKQVVLNCGDCTNTTFGKVIRNLTVNIGRNNAGAIGVQYNTSNDGYMGEVNIVSEDGQGVAGLALAGVENGPGQIRNVTIKGFDIGIYSASAYAVASSGIEIDGARKVGLFNWGKTPGDDWTIRMAEAGAPAVVNKRVLALINVKLSGPASDQPALVNEGNLYLRNAKAEGFAAVMKDAGAEVKEFHTGEPRGMFHNTQTALALPIKRQPLVPYETDPEKWLVVTPTGQTDAERTDNFEKALHTPGKTHIFIKDGAFRISRPVKVGPDVVRIVGASDKRGAILPSKGVKPTPTLIVGDGNSPVVVLDDIKCTWLTVDTDRTVVLNSIRCFQWGPVTHWFIRGGGEVFINDTNADILVDDPKTRVWMRHYNAESKQDSTIPWANIMVKAGRLWVLGWKSESLKRRVIVEKQGAVEVIGFDNYSVSRKNLDGDWPVFEVKEGQFSFEMLTQSGRWHNRNLVWEHRNGETRKFTTEVNGGKNCMLYAGYDPARRANAEPTAR
jgi:hypothetical protein